MIVTQPDGTVYRVWWDHRSAPEYTHCLIRMGNRSMLNAEWDTAPVIQDTAILNPKDRARYSRNTGHKISLARAIKRLDGQDDPHLHAVRHLLFWRAYREQLGHW